LHSRIAPDSHRRRHMQHQGRFGFQNVIIAR
jgi:hypothetical protein